VGVVGARTPQKFKLGVSDTQKKLKGNIRPTSQQRDVGISHYQAAVNFIKRCVKAHKIAHETPQNPRQTQMGELTMLP